MHTLVNEGEIEDLSAITTDVYVPKLCDTIQMVELEASTKPLVDDKACGPDGIPPGVIKRLPMILLILILQMFNMIFDGSAVYPT